jgi:hypothetical protein
MRAFAEDSLDQFAHMPDALRDHDPKLRKMRPERVRQHRLLPDQRCMRTYTSIINLVLSRQPYKVTNW